MILSNVQQKPFKKAEGIALPLVTNVRSIQIENNAMNKKVRVVKAKPSDLDPIVRTFFTLICESSTIYTVQINTKSSSPRNQLLQALAGSVSNWSESRKREKSDRLESFQRDVRIRAATLDKRTLNSSISNSVRFSSFFFFPSGPSPSLSYFSVLLSLHWPSSPSFQTLISSSTTCSLHTKEEEMSILLYLKKHTKVRLPHVRMCMCECVSVCMCALGVVCVSYITLFSLTPAVHTHFFL